MLTAFFHWLADTVLALGYPGIVILMAIESSVLPLPSELVIPPAGYLAAQGKMSAPLAVACGTAGSVLGAMVNYALAVLVGEPVLRRYGRYVLVSERALDRSEKFFRRHGEISTFVGRLLPVIDPLGRPGLGKRGQLGLAGRGRHGLRDSLGLGWARVVDDLAGVGAADAAQGGRRGEGGEPRDSRGHGDYPPHRFPNLSG